MSEFDRNEIEKRLKALDAPWLCVAFAARISTLALAFLAHDLERIKPFLWFWAPVKNGFGRSKNDRRKKHLLALMRAWQCTWGVAWFKYYDIDSFDAAVNAANAAYAATSHGIDDAEAKDEANKAIGYAYKAIVAATAIDTIDTIDTYKDACAAYRITYVAVYATAQAADAAYCAAFGHENHDALAAANAADVANTAYDCESDANAACVNQIVSNYILFLEKNQNIVEFLGQHFGWEFNHRSLKEMAEAFL